MESTVSTAAGFTDGVTGIITDMGSVSTFIWSLFSKFLNLFVEYPLIAYPVLFAILGGATALVIRIVRKFGVRGRTK